MVLWVICSLILAAILTPWAYQGGKALSDLADAKELPHWLDWLAEACGRAKVGRFFSRSLVASGLVLMPFLFKRLHALPGGGNISLRKVPARNAAAQVLTGMVIAGVLLWCTGLIMEAAGAYYDDPGHHGKKVLSKVVAPAIVAPLVEEWLFRGLLLGLWLKFARPLAACVGTSVVFSFIHFLEPPAGYVIANPGSPLAGFELLGKIMLHFADPLFFVADFASLFWIGMILAWTRLKTGALWFPMGLHAGWIIAFKTFNLYHTDAEGNWLHPWIVGESLRSGLAPIVTLIITGVICRFVIKPFGKPDGTTRA